MERNKRETDRFRAYFGRGLNKKEIVLLNFLQKATTLLYYLKGWFMKFFFSSRKAKIKMNSNEKKAKRRERRLKRLAAMTPEQLTEYKRKLNERRIARKKKRQPDN